MAEADGEHGLEVEVEMEGGNGLRQFDARLFAVVRHRALERSANTAAADMRDRLVELVPWDAVVLCDEELTMEVLMASARKTVATAAEMMAGIFK